MGERCKGTERPKKAARAITTAGVFLLRADRISLVRGELTDQPTQGEVLLCNAPGHWSDTLDPRGREAVAEG